MEKNILVIDDSPDARELELLRRNIETAVNDQSHQHYVVRLHYINPNEYIVGSVTDENALDAFFQHLNDNFLNQKLDLLLCDFNLHVRNKDLAFHILRHVRDNNKSCSIVLFSGSPLKELTRINNQELANQIVAHIRSDSNALDPGTLKTKIDRITEEELPSDDLLKIALQAGITKIVSRPQFKNAAIECIKNPSLLLSLENSLCIYGSDNVFENTGMSIDNLPISDICFHLRQQSREGIKFTQELIELMASHFIALNRN